MSKKAAYPYSQLGLAGAAFACVLVGASISQPPIAIKTAMSWLAVGIPLSVAAAYGFYLKNRLPDLPRTMLAYISSLAAGIGNIACFGGIYWMFRSVSTSAASTFLTLSISAYAIITGTEVALEAFEKKRARVRRSVVRVGELVSIRAQSPVTVTGESPTPETDSARVGTAAR